MDTTQTRRYEMLVRVRDFGNAHGDLFPDSSLAREHFGTVAAAVTQLSTHAVSKLSAAQEGKSTKAMAREALYDRLAEIGRTVRAIAGDTPGLEDKFQLPAFLADQALITTGRLFARDAEAFTAQLIGHGMPTTFVSDLLGLVERFEQAIHDREARKDERAAARAHITAALASGTAAVRKLDAMLANHLKDDPATVVVWQRDRRCGHPRRGRSAAAEQSPAPAASAPGQTEVTS